MKVNGNKGISISITAIVLVALMFTVSVKDLHHLFAHEEAEHCEARGEEHFHGTSAEECSVCDMQMPLHLPGIAAYISALPLSTLPKKVHKTCGAVNSPSTSKAARAPPARI